MTTDFICLLFSCTAGGILATVTFYSGTVIIVNLLSDGGWRVCCWQMYASDFNRFRMEEVPKHLKQKYHLSTLHDELKVL